MNDFFVSKKHTCLKVSKDNSKLINFYMLTTEDKWSVYENKINLTKTDIKKLINFLNEIIK